MAKCKLAHQSNIQPRGSRLFRLNYNRPSQLQWDAIFVGTTRSPWLTVLRPQPRTSGWSSILILTASSYVEEMRNG
jgi:hypothetical protein